MDIMNSTSPAWLNHARLIVSEFESCSLISYPDPGTNGEPWTIGWGHTGPEIRRNQRISQAMADGYLIIDLKETAQGVFNVLPQVENYSPQQQAALISFVYNVGSGALAESTLKKRLDDSEDPLTVVSEELPKWNKANGKVLAGLTKRRKAEVELFKKGTPKAVPVQTEAKEGFAIMDPKPVPKDAPPVWPAGMVGPKKRPDLKPGDHHIIANDIAETMTAYSSDGVRLWQIPCLCRGQGGEAEWGRTGEDTPPGLYLVGKVYRDYEEDPSEQFSETRRAYGWFSFDLIGQEAQEGPDSKPYRDGIMIHGGGSACGWPGAWKPMQSLHPTLGCIRLHNSDLKDKLLPMVETGGRIWISVLQEAKK